MANETSENAAMRNCGNCAFCRRRAPHGGVQIVTGEVDYFCYGMPPTAGIAGPGRILSIRPPVSETDAACSKWRARA